MWGRKRYEEVGGKVGGAQARGVDARLLYLVGRSAGKRFDS